MENIDEIKQKLNNKISAEEILPIFVDIFRAIEEIKKALALDVGDINSKIESDLKDVGLKLDELKVTIDNTKKQKGEDGYTPIKGKDYFDGKDYVLTQQDKREIAKSIDVPIVEKVVEKIEVIKEQPVVTEVTKEIKVENPFVLIGSDVVDKINELEILPEYQIGKEHIKGLENIEKLIKQQSRNNVGGVHYLAGSGISIEGNVISSTGTPQTPWLSNIDAAGYGLGDLGYLQFDTTITPITNAEGLLQWNATDGTLDLGMQGGTITQQIGQEMFIKVRNASGSPILNGTPVYFNGRQGNRPKIYPAKSDADATSMIMGVTTEDIPDNSDGYITTFGYVRQIKTDYSGTGNWGTTWVEGDNLYVSKTVAGQLTNVEPTSPHHSDIVGQVGVVGAAGIGSIFVNINRHKTLFELSDVDGTPLTTTGQIPVWDQTNGCFDFNYNITNYLTSVGTGVANELTYWSGINTLGSLATATYPSLTELSYVKGVTSAIQTQLDDRLKLNQSSPQTITASPILNWGTSTRIPYYSGTKTLTDSANFTYDGSTMVVNQPGSGGYFQRTTLGGTGSDAYNGQKFTSPALEIIGTSGGINFVGINIIAFGSDTPVINVQSNNGSSIANPGTRLSFAALFARPSGVGGLQGVSGFSIEKSGGSEGTLWASDLGINLGAGTTPSARIHAKSTTEQLRLGYDSSNYFSTTVNSGGNVTFDSVGGSAGFTFNDSVVVNGNVTGGEASGGAYIQSSTNSSLIYGYALGDDGSGNYSNLSVTSGADGSFVSGNARYGAYIAVDGGYGGATALGYVDGIGGGGDLSHITASSQGALAQGNADGGGYIQAYGTASVAQGYASYYDASNNVSYVKASSTASFARGSAVNGAHIEAYGIGSTAFGNVDGEGSYISTNDSGAIAFGNIDGRTNSYISAVNRGSLAGGHVDGNDATISSTNDGAFTFGRVDDNGILNASGSASFVLGYASDSTIAASAEGAFAGGRSTNNNISANGVGSFAFGYADGDTITAGGDGSFAGGKASAGSISTGEAGSFVWGDDIHTSTSGDFAFALGKGITNTTPLSLEIGFGQVDLHVESGAVVIPAARVNVANLPTSPTGLATGDIWVDTTGGLNILKVV